MKKTIGALLMAALFCCVHSFGQVTVAPFLSPRATFSCGGNTPCAGGKLYTCVAGLACPGNPLATYVDSTGTTLNPNPIILDANGQASIWLSAATYKFVLQNSNGVTQWTADGISWVTPLTSFNGIIDTGSLTMQQPTAATNSANQNSNQFEMDATYWTGAASALDKWIWQVIEGSGSNPTTTLTLSHSGSSGTASVNFSGLINFAGVNLVNSTVGLTGAINNAIIKNNGSGFLANSSILDDGSHVTFGEPINYANLTGTQSTTFGSHATTTTETIINAGAFPYAAPFPQSGYLAVDINGVDFQQQQIYANRPGVLDAIAGGVHVPSTQTAMSGGFGMQFDGIAGYAYNESPQGNPVGVYGQATVFYNTAGTNQTWAANFWCGEGTGNTPMTQNGSCYGLEIDFQQLTGHLGGWAEDFNGNVTQGGVGGLLFVKPGVTANSFWSPGIEFGIGATKATDTSGNGAIVFLPLATGNSQSSQGMLFESVDAGGTTHFISVGENLNGGLAIGVPSVANRFGVSHDGTLEVKKIAYDLGGTPSPSGCTGLGSGSCSLDAGSNDDNGNIVLSPTGSPASSGNVTLTFSASAVSDIGVTLHNENCQFWITNGSNGWNFPGAGAVLTNANSLTSVTIGWNNNGVALTAGNTYRIGYRCGAY